MPNPPETPAAIALDDQFRAAGTHAATWLAETGRGQGVRTPAHQAPRWQRDTAAAMQAAVKAGTADYCRHLRGGPQPVVLHAERPDLLLCRDCHVAALADRTCLDCGLPAGTRSPEGGHEDVIRGPVAIYSRVRCPACGLREDPLHGTFGNGGQ